MEDKNQPIMNEMEETRTALSEKLEALEAKVAARVEPVAEAVERATTAAADIVKGVKETVQDVKATMASTVRSVTSVFNMREQTKQHPWLVFTLATSTGCVLGNLLTGRRARPVVHEAVAAQSPARHKHGGNGRHHRSPPNKLAITSESAESQSWFAEEARRLRSLALSTLMGAIRDLSVSAFSGELGDRIAAEIDRITVHLGGEPIHGHVLQCGGGVDESGARTEAVNRLRGGEPEPGLN
jgi:ElaB/YqjD/DUF883 family membrane-anchored ribosome-binding protein